jgi:hypothetical protein
MKGKKSSQHSTARREKVQKRIIKCSDTLIERRTSWII